MLRDVWENAPRVTRSQSPLPPAEWESTLSEGYYCFISIPGSNTVLLSHYGRCLDLTSVETPPSLRQFADRRTFSIYFDAADAKLAVPAEGTTLHVSKSCGSADVWATLVAAMLFELNLGQAHTVEFLESNGLTFTDGYVNQVDHWIRCTVLAVHRTEKSIELIAEIQSVVWNQPLDVE